MFHYDEGLFLTGLHLAIDVTRRQPLGYISHAHADRIARHERAMGTTPTLGMVHQRLQHSLTVDVLDYHKPLVRHGVKLTALPAGHILGASMLLVEDDDCRYLITGDFSLNNSSTAGQAELAEADVLIMECTFGQPEFRMPPRETVIEQLLDTTSRLLRLSVTPLIRTYVIGKAQELIKIFTRAHLPVVVHPQIDTFATLYSKYGCDVGQYSVVGDDVPSGHVVLYPPAGSRHSRLHSIPQPCEELVVTGWAAQKDHPRVGNARYSFPLSDHADYDDLLETVQRVKPRRVYCHHGSQSFVDDLRKLGHDAHWLTDCQVIR